MEKEMETTIIMGLYRVQGCPGFRVAVYLESPVIDNHGLLQPKVVGKK